MIFFYANIPDIISMFWDRRTHTHLYTCMITTMNTLVWFGLQEIVQTAISIPCKLHTSFYCWIPQTIERIQEPLYFPSLERFCISSLSGTSFWRLLLKTPHCLIQEACRWLAFLDQHWSVLLGTVIVLIHPDAHLPLVMGLPYHWHVCSEVNGTLYGTWKFWTSPVSQLLTWGKEGAQSQMTKKGLILSFSNHRKQSSSSRAEMG